jgi:lipid A 3-O-deacylase
MRVGGIVGAAFAVALLGTNVHAADLSASAAYAPPPYLAPVAPVSFVSELRIGASAQELFGPEKGSWNVTGEVLFAKPFTTADLFTSYFVPRPHIGASVNLGGKTSFAYAGLTWTVDLGSQFFVEGTFGGAVHNGNTNSDVAFVRRDRNALGCSPLFRESASVGYRFTPNWSIMATIEHLSNAGICGQNRGLTNVGARVGYTF